MMLLYLKIAMFKIMHFPASVATNYIANIAI